ncbi:unnamed protein product, partial [Hapterophycus canaliculatus]
THPQGRNKAGSRSSRRGSAEFQAEAYLDWPCVRCTFINAYTEEACGGCGGGNRKRDRLLRERKEQAEKRGRLESLRQCRDKSLKEEAFKDVLEDSSDDGDNDDNGGIDGNQARGKQSAISAPHQTSTATLTPAAAAAKSSSTIAPSSSSRDNDTQAAAAAAAAEGQHQKTHCHSSSGNACVINILPPDLLLQCAEYLGDARSLCRVREVCFAWTVSLDDREAGRRLWRPLFYRLRASGSIDRATDTTGQQNRKLKVYDLGGATTATPAPNRRASSDAAASVRASPAGLAASAPSPSQQRQRSSSLSSSSAAAAAAAAAGRGFSALAKGSSGSIGNAVTGAVSSSCVVCGLIQREGYSGRDCEMCASALTSSQGRQSPATPRLAYTRVNLSGGAARDSSSAYSCSSMPHRQHQRPEQRASVAGARPSPSVLHRQTHERASDDGVDADGAAGGTPGASTRVGTSSTQDREEGGPGSAASNVDWHFLVKRLAEEKRIASGWGSLHHGWLWLQRALQTMLRRRRGNEPCAISETSQTGGTEAGVPGQPGSQQQRQQQQQIASTAVAGGRATGDASLGELDPTIARLVRKLASKKWVLLYDSLKATFTLQAEGIARKVVFEAMAAAANAAARD